MTIIAARTTAAAVTLETHDLRDLGGSKGRAGQTVRWHRLYRSDGLVRASRRDLTALADLGLRTVVDLRTEREARAEPLGVLPGALVELHRLPMRARPLGAATDPAALTAQHLELLVQGAPAIVDALDLFAQPGAYPILLHSADGDDRVAVVVAVVLALLGVHHEEVAYGAAGAPREARTDARADARADARYRMLVEVRERCGSMVGFARGIGVPFETIEGVHRALLE